MALKLDMVGRGQLWKPLLNVDSLVVVICSNKLREVQSCQVSAEDSKVPMVVQVRVI